MTVEPIPTYNLLGFTRARQFRRKLRPYFASVPITELVECASVLIKDSVIRMDQTKETGLVVSSESFRILLEHPRRAIRVAVKSYDILVRDCQREYGKLNRNRLTLVSGSQSDFAAIEIWRRIGRYPDIKPECGSGLIWDVMIQIRYSRAKGDLHRNQSVRVVPLIGLVEVEPLAVSVDRQWKLDINGVFL